jgi:hypothetical protein
MTFPAFKEWHVIVEALGAGEQVLILRKGGIAEGRSGFQVIPGQTRFWLFPTRFHEQRTKTKPTASRWFTTPSSRAENDDGVIALRHFAELESARFVSDLEAIARLDAHHFWTEETVRERFDWSQPPGLHVLVVRVHRLVQPIVLPVTPAMGGCKSWIELPCAFDAQASVPVLGDEAFCMKIRALGL